MDVVDPKTLTRPQEPLESQPGGPRHWVHKVLRQVARWQGTPVGYLVSTAALMALSYGLLYQPYDPEAWPGTWLLAYLHGTAQASAWVLTVLGEQVVRQGTQVFGRFPYVVVLDCAALDAQALFVAAVIAFPARWWKRAVGVILGIAFVFGINVARLALLYFAGAHSQELFRQLHEEVLVFAIILLVCAVFGIWVLWARQVEPQGQVAHAE